jgi:hypothetical protein
MWNSEGSEWFLGVKEFCPLPPGFAALLAVFSRLNTCWNGECIKALPGEPMLLDVILGPHRIAQALILA